MANCLLYQELEEITSKPWEANKANAGLVFNKFASGWKASKDSWEFDNGKTSESWLKKFAQRSYGDSEQIEDLARRQHQLIQALGGKVYALRNTSRFIMGMGNAHPIENGLTWHPTLGVPYLPGSSLKGVLRSWDLQEHGELCSQGRQNLRQEAIKAFGSQNEVGELIFFDLLPLEPVKLVCDIMTPHYGGYYQKKKIPGDWESPMPIQFLALEKDQEWQLGVAFQERVKRDEVALWLELDDLIEDALSWLGAGAKTAVGYGRFERVVEIEKQWKGEVEELAKKKREEEQKAARQAELEHEYSLMPPALAEIRRISDKENWLDNEGKPHPEKFSSGLNAYLENKESLPLEVLNWLKEVFTKRHLNLWDKPDETTGKKNKPVHKRSWSDLVRKVKAMGEA